MSQQLEVTVSFSYLVIKQDPSESLFESRFSIIVYLKERFIICLDSFCKTKKVFMFERVFFYYQWQFQKSITKSEHYCNQTLFHLRLMEVVEVR